ncbi:hypothetical protein SD77_2576 [Bacillus badius]|uniref:Mobile element protein n=1 Tax=Bacillus badius TaxID=1455 RepID=A0ABR5AZD7_BACBA|nr:hypothetical protein SD78_1969 [Bacillus badius]KIL80122.1 hypothetical protein SD77_2576 [Bacillus badius]
MKIEAVDIDAIAIACQLLDQYKKLIQSVTCWWRFYHFNFQQMSQD